MEDLHRFNGSTDLINILSSIQKKYHLHYKEGLNSNNMLCDEQHQPRHSMRRKQRRYYDLRQSTCEVTPQLCHFGPPPAESSVCEATPDQIVHKICFAAGGELRQLVPRWMQDAQQIWSAIARNP